ncbi:MAG: hypothetical protein K0S41_4374 [Anaerocolumna sp.]|nr:hypothetical protein [Anaerocolumna sp.]
MVYDKAVILKEGDENMKPIVVYDIEKYDGDENLLLINKGVFNKLLEDVYNAGIQDANKNNFLRSPFVPVEITCETSDIGKSNIRGTQM